MRMMEVKDAWTHLPVVTLERLLEGRVPLVLAPHPDDESLGCGGLLAQCAAAGIPAQVAILTDGSRSHPGSRTHPPARLAAVRRAEAETALGTLGLPAQALHWIAAEDTRLPQTGGAAEAIRARLSAICARTGCTLLLSPWRHDPHCDHEAAAELAANLAAERGLSLLSYPVWGWTLPDDAERAVAAPAGMRLEITDQLPAKRCAIRAHATQYGDAITDSPEGFTLPETLLSVFRRRHETFLSA
jgi:LmbE family N-acetylglucosaminyl deacetylase